MVGRPDQENIGMWNELAEYARFAPSPHNTQPTRLHVVDDEHAELHFVPSRGLPVGDPVGRFTYLTFGIFAEMLRIAAHARRHQLEVDYVGGPLYDRLADEPRKVATLRLVRCDAPIEDLDPELILRRRTNRHPYDNRPLPEHLVGRLREEAARSGHIFNIATDDKAVQWVKELNRDALYHDLEHERYRAELGSWLRYSDREARRRRDGLSASALVLPGWLLKGVMRHHRVLTAPVIKPLTQQIYMRTMDGISTVGWLQGDYVDEQDWTGAGHLMARLWLILTEHGVDWQPYGSIITNDESRAAMVDKFGLQEGDGGRDTVWLLVRMGYAQKAPVRSERLPVSEVMA